MKRRNAECGKMRRPVKRNKITDGIYGSTLLYLKFLLLWAVVILADFILEFRFEFLWPFWMLLRSVYDSFKYQGLAFSVFFVCIALTSDMICFFFIPVQWVFFAASTYVWVQYVWHTDKGICLPTMILCSVFVYMEGGVRLRDLRHMPAHVDLCRPFAAHCIGYPVVTLGFGLKSYVGHHIRIRRQKQVAKENGFYMQLLQEALPLTAHSLSAIKESTDKTSSLAIEKVTEASNVPEKQHMNGNAIHMNNNINSNHNNHSTSSNTSSNSKSNHSKKPDIHRSTSQSTNISTSILSTGDTSTAVSNADTGVLSSQMNSIGGGKASHNHNLCNSNSVHSSHVSTLVPSTHIPSKHHAHTNGVAVHAHSQSDVQQTQHSAEGDAPQPEKNIKGSKSNSSKQEKKELTNTQREESRRKNKNKDKENHKETIVKEKENKESTNSHKERESNSLKEKESNSNMYKEKEKDIVKEMEIHKEKESHKERESRKDKERDKEKEELQQKHMEHKENCERQLRQLRTEITQLRSQNEQLGSRANAARAAERAAISSVERRVSEERRRAEGCRQRRVALETEVATLRQQLHQTRERGQRLERDLQSAEHQVSTMESKMRENGPEAWRTALNTLRDRAQQLERSLSAETRIKMDLFSAVGEAKRLSGLREGVIRSQEKEIEELKGKIAQMLAVMPSDPFPSSYHMQVSHVHPHLHPLPSPPSSGNPLSNLDPNATAYTPKSNNHPTIKG